MAASAKSKTASKKKAVAPAAKKIVAKPVAKPAAKKVVKPAAKPTTKPAAKTVAKPTPKSAQKPTTPAAKKPAATTPAKVAAPKTAIVEKKVSPPSPTPVAVRPSKPAVAAPAAKVVPQTSSFSTRPVTKTNTVPATTPQKAIVISLDAHKKYAGLTEAEIVKQPEGDYMNKAQLAFFKEKLTELRGTILHNATDTGEHLRDVEVATDPSDRATQEEEYTLELRTRDRERKLLKKVDKCLRMIDDGSFGWCEETGEPIGLARLIARPTATLSIEAQERRERMQKLYGD
jgi:DnaK suppressor protein